MRRALRHDGRGPAPAGHLGEAQVTPAAGYVPPDDTPAIRIGATIFARLHGSDRAEGHRRRRQHLHAELLQRRPRLSERHRPDQPHHPVSRHARHRARNRRRQLEHRQLCLPPEVRLRPVQPRRLDDARLMGSLRHAADPVDRLHRQRLPLPLPGPDSRRPRRHPLVVRRRRLVPLQLQGELRRRPHRLLQRRQLQPRRSQRSEGVDDARHGPAAADGSVACAVCASPASTTSTPTSRTARSAAASSAPPTNTPTSTPASTTSRRRIRRAPSIRSSTATATRCGRRRRPAKGYGWEGLLRFDHLVQEQATATVEGERNRTIAGVAYWFPRQGAVSSALLFDYEQVDNDRLRAGPRRRTALDRAHAGQLLGETI